MKHLRVLEDAHLVTTQRDGRRKLHYLNPVPIRLIADRWISRYAAGFVRGMADLKYSLEAQRPMTAPAQVYEIYIRTTPERLWAAITDPETRKKFHFGNRIESDWAAGSGYEVTNPGAPGPLVEGKNLEVDPPHRLVQTMTAMWSDEAKAVGESRVTWEIEPVGDSCRLLLIHDELPDGAPEEVYGGWPQILSGLKTWLETGQVLTTPGSLMYT
jgi:uncharacterized protein YndB with AHSA1/START domain